MRPLKRYFDSQLDLKSFYQSIKCKTPHYLFDQKLFETPEDRLNCPLNVNITKVIEKDEDKYDVTPDLKIKELKMYVLYQ